METDFAFIFCFWHLLTTPSNMGWTELPFIHFLKNNWIILTLKIEICEGFRSGFRSLTLMAKIVPSCIMFKFFSWLGLCFWGRMAKKIMQKWNIFTYTCLVQDHGWKQSGRHHWDSRFGNVEHGLGGFQHKDLTVSDLI